MTVNPHRMPEEWELALEDIDDALALLDELPDVPAAIEFGDGVRETLEGMRETIEKNRHVTERQQKAITNITDGIGRWLHR